MIRWGMIEYTSFNTNSSTDMILRYIMPSEEDKQRAVELMYKDIFLLSGYE